MSASLSPKIAFFLKRIMGKKYLEKLLLQAKNDLLQDSPIKGIAAVLNEMEGDRNCNLGFD